MSAREQYRPERIPRREAPIGRDPWPAHDELPSWREILGGMALLVGVALLLWLFSVMFSSPQVIQ